METLERIDRVQLEAITASITNRLFRSRKELSPDALQELADSIRQLDVIQPVTVRPDPDNAERFILISGERRFRASKLAGKSDIPAYIRDVDEATALKMQITENVEREDIHPLRQAKGYKLMLEQDPNLTTAELALQFGKSETYIVQRLKLNDLISEGKKDFAENRMSFGHALIIARLLPKDQKEAIRQISDSSQGYGTITQLQNFIARSIINNLSAAPFQLDDADLVKKAGACTLCPKRTGTSPTLFADMADQDRCIDRGCFTSKCNAFLVRKTKEVIESEPEVVFLEDYHSPIPEVSEIISEHKIKTLREYSDFTDNDKTGKKVKGLWLSGNRAGFIQAIYLRLKASRVHGEDDKDTVISKIKDRIKRGRQLDEEKVYAKILDALKAHPSQQKDFGKLNRTEEVFVWFVVYDKAGYGIKEELRKIIGTQSDSPAKFFEKLKELTPEKKGQMLRKVILDQYGGNYPNSDYGHIIRKIAESYGDVDIATFETEQAEIKAKRESRAKERIKLLQQNN